MSTPVLTVSTSYDADGKLRGSLERHYNEQGEQIEVIDIRPDGRRVRVKI